MMHHADRHERGGLREWLFPRQDRREAVRHTTPGLTAFYWDGDASQGHQVRDISTAGLYLPTQDRWYPGTIVRFVLQKNCDDKQPAPIDSLVVSAKAVRHDIEGVGFHFVGVKPADRRRIGNFVRDQVNANISRTAHGTRLEQGHALIEYALLLPLLLLLIINIVNFGGFLFAWITVSNAARAGAQYEVLGGASPTAPAPTTPAQVAALVTNDISSLLKRDSLLVRVCTNNNGTITSACFNKNGPITCSTGSAPPLDPEPASYVLTTVDVTYTYNPYIPLFNFPRLGIRATLPPTTIHRMAVMRAMQ
jgi:Flp pilus assembly protein TadG